MGTKRDLAGMEARRLQGARLLKRGVAQAEVARELNVSRQTVSRWAKRLASVKGAVGELKARALGRPPRVSPEQREGLREILLAGALQAGFPTQLWTIKRVRAVFKQRFDIGYSMAGCWHLLREMGFTPQKPEKRATQRDEEAIGTWKRKTWPALKKRPKPREERSSSSTSPGSRRSVR